MSRRMLLALVTGAAVAVSAVALAAVMWPRADAGAPPVRTGPVASRYAAVPAGARPMPFEKKGTALPADYPLQVPIIDGAVVRAGAPAQLTWMYELEVALPPEGVAAWYRRAYEGAAWTVVAESREQVSDGVRVTLSLEKGGAVSEIVVESRPAGALVRATIGIGERGGST